MRVIEITEDRGLAPADRDAPRTGGTDVAVDVAFCGVCGSDLHMLEDPSFPTRSVLGHELSGVVRAVGPQVTAVSVGDAVAVLPYESCGTCRSCTTGRENLCASGGHLGSVIGVQRPGGLASTVVADETSVVPLPAGATLEQGALAEPVAVACRAAGKVAGDLDDLVVVVGAGPIGVLVALVLRAQGRRNVHVLEVNGGRRDRAASLGLPVLEPEEGTDAALRERDVATFVDCTGSPGAVALQLGAVRRGGRVVLVGLGPPVQLDAESAILREVEIVGSAGYSRRDFQTAVQLLASGAVPADELITRIAPVAEAASVFADLRDPATPHIKVLLRHDHRGGTTND
ncbi:alcohol dehydrogenase catalytic domain-containing protein [Nocardioides zeae]|uniref:Alcohol dehydrogenase catalytic domain-containing protein n=1 Tax=Nocardioides imazamoxiresistens TaxID=3231893 RepID=A0ABU3PWP8_9ACTN|nr:alcohol dehydrogenase catalytic domain-containing protein [Nocardioides zeae]MDT9593301.1 alcohol dehydrogenase catalytic domain-containing protein [Nocardioides zeae]